MLVAGGVLTAFLMPVGLFPTVRFPRIAVTIDAGDRPADQTEVVVTRPVEQALRAIPGVQNVRSTTSRGSAEISINFAWGSNMDLALQRAEAALTRAPADPAIRRHLLHPAHGPDGLSRSPPTA